MNEHSVGGFKHHELVCGDVARIEIFSQQIVSVVSLQAGKVGQAMTMLRQSL